MLSDLVSTESYLFYKVERRKHLHNNESKNRDLRIEIKRLEIEKQIADITVSK
jgi:hypothetical protein